MKRWRPSIPDVLVALALVAVEVGGAALTSRDAGEPTLTAAAVVLLLVQTVPVAWARINPVAVWVVTLAAAVVYGVRDYPDPFLVLGPLVALYMVVALRPRRDAVVIGVCSLTIAVLGAILAGDSSAEDFALAVVMVALAWTLGDLQRQRDEQATQRQIDVTHQAVAAERARIARELHDVVAHHVSMMVVQSEAGASAGASADAVERFDAIAGTGRTTLAELRHLLGVLRDVDDATLEPQPGLERIDDLVRNVRGAGLSVDVTIEGSPRPVPPGVALSAYRIVQEALTNTLRHAGPAHASVAIRYSNDALDVEVADDGAAPANDADGGFGLVGIRERVALFGGSLSVGARQGGGFVIAARLPVRDP